MRPLDMTQDLCSFCTPDFNGKKRYYRCVLKAVAMGWEPCFERHEKVCELVRQEDKRRERELLSDN